jgi:Tol biopolymer transport system component
MRSVGVRFLTARAIQTAQAEPFPGVPAIPPRVQQLITAMLAKNPAVRPCAAEVALELGRISQLLTHSKNTFKNVRAIAAGVLVLLAVLAVWPATNGRTKNGAQNLKVHPLTSQAGWERRPAISPDGQSIAYTWSERLDGPADIYLQRFDQKSSVKLTASQPGELGYMTWSPDGQRIAFLRGSGRSYAIYSIETSGGAEQKILDLRRGNLSCSLDWSPDGNLIAFTDQLPTEDRMAAYLYNLRTGEKRLLTSPPAGLWGDWSPAFSPDGETIAFKRVTGFWADELYVVPTAGGPLRKLTNFRRGIWGFAWETDGKSLIVSCQRGSTQFGIWRFLLSDPDHPELIQQGGADAIMPASSRRTRRAAWVSQLWDLNVYRMNLNGSSPPVRLIASTLRDQNPESAPDGTIAWISDRSGSRDVWIARRDGSEQVQVTNLNGPQIDHLQWSHDGRTLAFDSRPEGATAIFLMHCDTAALTCGKPKALTEAGVAEVPTWSADDRFIYFTSRAKGRYTIWKAPAEGGEPMAVIGNGAAYCRESRDGKWLYFTRADGRSIWRIRAPAYGSVAGAEEELVVGDPYNVQNTGWTLSADEIFFIDKPVGQRSAAVRGYRMATKQMRTIVPLAEVFPDRGDITVSVSHDGRTILYSQLDRSGSNVIVAENIQ